MTLRNDDHSLFCAHALLLPVRAPELNGVEYLFLTGELRHGGTELDDPRRPESTADGNPEVLENGPSEVISFPLCLVSVRGAARPAAAS